MSQPLFENSYTLRKVNLTDSKSCFICYKPSQCVLITPDKQDFFYVCESHLKDANFASPIHTSEYTSAIEEKKALKTKFDALKQKVSTKENSWSGFLDKINWNSKTDTPDKDDTKDKPEPSIDSHKTKDEKTTTKPDIAIDEDRLNLDLMNKKLKELDIIINKPFKSFNLHKDIYRIRLNQHYQKKKNKQILDNMSKPGFFPSTNNLPNLPSRDNIQ